MFIWCDFYLDDFDLGRYVKLTPELDSALLTASPPQQRDPVIVARSLEIADEYEREFTRTLCCSLKPGHSVEIYGAAFFDPLHSSDSADVFTMKFVRIERSTQTDYSGRNEDVTAVVLIANNNQHEVRFTRRVLTKYGRFGGVRLWCAYVPQSVIDDDDNLQSEDHTTRVCVISSSDLFF